MVTYTDPVAKEWVLDTYEDFAQGNTAGTEIENPNYTGKIVLECLLGENILDTQERPWNPSFELRHITENRPNHWRFEDPSTGSTYVQGDPEEAYEGDDFVKLADEGPQGRIANKRGHLILDPENVSPNALQIDADPEKTFTIRYHGRYENPEEIRNRGPSVVMDVEEDEVKTEIKFDPFTEEEEYPVASSAVVYEN